MHSNKPLNIQEAENIAVQGLMYLANDQDLLGRFLSLTGLSPDELRVSIEEPAFLVGVLDFFMSDEKTLVEFSQAKKINPENISIARHLISGPENFEG